MRHNPRRPSQAAVDNPAGRTRNRIKESRVQDPDELDMSGPSQTQRPGPSRIGPPVQIPIPAPTLTSASALVRRVLEILMTASSVSSSVSFAPRLSIDGNSPRSDGGEGEEGNAADDTIQGASPARSPRLTRQEQERLLLTHGPEREPEVEINLEDRRGSPQQRVRDRPATGERHNLEDPAESERQRLGNETWEKNERANEAVRATQRHVRALTDETQVATTNLENMNRKLEFMRKKEERMTRLSLENERKEYE